MSRKKLSIAFVYDGNLKPSEGVPSYILSLGSYYEMLGHRVHYLVSQSVIRSENIYSLSKTVSLPFNGNNVETPLLANKKKITKLIEQIRPDIMHLQMPYSPLMAGRVIKVAAKLNIPIFGTFHIFPESKHVIVGAKILNLLNFRTKKCITRVISVSSAAAKFADSAFNISSEVIPCPIDLKKLSQATPLTNYQGDKLNIVFMGRLVERKGCEYFIRAVGQLNKSDQTKIRVLIGGGGPLESHLIRLTGQLGLKNIITFLGYIEENSKPNFLRTADIAVFPSLGGESFGIMVVEAMGSGAGVVLGGNNEGYRGVLNENPELLFEPRNTVRLADMLARLVNDKNKRNELHDYEQKLVRQFDISIVGSKLLDEYYKLI